MKTKKKLVYQDRKRETYLHLEIEMSVAISSERNVSLTFDNEADEAWRVPVALGLEYVLERMPSGGAYQGLSARVFMVDARQLDFTRYADEQGAAARRGRRDEAGVGAHDAGADGGEARGAVPPDDGIRAGAASDERA